MKNEKPKINEKLELRIIEFKLDKKMNMVNKIIKKKRLNYLNINYFMKISKFFFNKDFSFILQFLVFELKKIK